jgi:sortase B
MESEKKIKIARKVLWVVDDVINLLLLAALLGILALGIYDLWDTRQIYEKADSVKYEVYKPSTEEDTVSFEELQSLNSDVFGWITIYGTGVDYPLVQGEDNDDYLNRDATGNYSASGSIFLDYRNNRDFSDYNNIIHGHHMAASAMFGDLSKFADEDFFDSHKYGNLYKDGRNYGIVFFEYTIVDAYDQSVYAPGITGEEAQAEYLQLLQSQAKLLRQADQESAEHLLILSTCSSDITNGRSLLIGYLTDETYEDDFYEAPKEKTKYEGLEAIPGWKQLTRLPLWVIMLIILFVVSVMPVVLRKATKKIGQKQERKEQDGEREG